MTDVIRSADDTVQAVRCPRDPQVETVLRCGRCETPICPRCLVMTPVGARCRDCAQVRRLPTFEVSAFDVAKAVGAAVGSGLVVGAIWAFVPLGGFFRLVIAFLVGYAVAEVTSRAVNRKRAIAVQVAAAVGAAVAVIALHAVPLAAAQAPNMANVGIGLAIGALGALFNPIGWLLIAIAAAAAVFRFRR